MNIIKKLEVLLYCLILLTSISPVTAGVNELYTAINYVDLIDSYQETPYTLYYLSYEYEFWIEKESVDLTPETLGVDDRTCLIKMTISTSSDINYHHQGCLLQSRSPESLFNNSSYEEGIIDGTSITYPSGRREGLHVNETDYNATQFPNGLISFNLTVTDPTLDWIFGDLYGAIMETDNQVNTIHYDTLPEDYGNIENPDENFFHVRLKNIEPAWISPRNETFTEFKFQAEAEVLNIGDSFSHYFPSTCTGFLFINISISGTHPFISLPSVCGDAFTEKFFSKETRYVYEGHFSVIFDNQILDLLPDGEIELMFYSDQPDIHTYKARIFIDEGILTFDYDAKPRFWEDYGVYGEIETTLIDQTSTSMIDPSSTSLPSITSSTTLRSTTSFSYLFTDLFIILLYGIVFVFLKIIKRKNSD